MEGAIEQALVPVALLQRGPAVTRPGRFADSSHRAAIMVVDEIPPEGDGQGRIAADPAHVDEQNPARVGAELAGDHLGLYLSDSDQDRVAGGQRLAHERHRPCQVLVASLVDEGLVLETALFHWLPPAGLSSLPGAGRNGI